MLALINPARRPPNNPIVLSRVLSSLRGIGLMPETRALASGRCRCGHLNGRPTASRQFHRDAGAERNAADNTVAAYERDLKDLTKHLAGTGRAPVWPPGTISALFQVRARRQSLRTVARRLSALRQFCRFAIAELAADDPTAPDPPRLGRRAQGPERGEVQKLLDVAAMAGPKASGLR
jgi:site-specific recombinase XerD